MDTVTWVQILDDIVSISRRAYTLCKGKHPNILPQPMSSSSSSSSSVDYAF